MGGPDVARPLRLREVGSKLAAIEHLRVLRIHTRVPIVAPEWIDAATVAALQKQLR